MHMSVPLLKVIIAVQSLLVGGLLLAIAYPFKGIPPRALALRGAAMLLQALGYVLGSYRDEIGGFAGIILSFGFVLAGHAMTLVALRMLLGLNENRTLIVSTIAGVWLVMFWPGWIDPNRQTTALLSEVYSVGYACAVAWPLFPRLNGPSAKGAMILFATCVFMAVTQFWLILAQLLPLPPWTSLNAVLMLTALMPTLTGVGFLLLYSEMMQTNFLQLSNAASATGGARKSLERDDGKQFLKITAHEVLMFNQRKPASRVEVRDHWLMLDSEWRLTDHDFADDELGILAGELIFLAVNGLLRNSK